MLDWWIDGGSGWHFGFEDNSTRREVRERRDGPEFYAKFDLAQFNHRRDATERKTAIELARGKG
jgi:hypothetical protein